MPKSVVTQSMLNRYHHLASRERNIKEKRELLRTKLLTMLQDGASVEPGRLWPTVSKFFVRPLTQATVTAAIGEKRYQQIRGLIAPQERCMLQVREVLGRTKSKVWRRRL